MSIVVLSYRENYDLQCSRGCCNEGSGPSQFEIHLARTEEDAARFLAEILYQDEDAKYLHFLLTNWTELEALNGFSESPCKGVDSIKMPYMSYDFEEENCILYSKYQEEEKERDKMCINVTYLTKCKLSAMKEKEKQKKIAEESRKKEEYNKLQLEAQKKQYESLKAKFESDVKLNT